MADDDTSLDGVVIVTGSAAMRSIGRATALKAAELGADLVVSDIRRSPERIGEDERQAGWRGLESLADEVMAHGRKCEVAYCDITQRSQVAALVNGATRLGRLVGLVNAARAFTGDDGLALTDISAEEWDQTMAVNVRGPLTCSALAARAMMTHGSGSIVNVSSIRGSHPVAGKGSYSVSKAALEMLTRVMAIELGPHGIRVNAVAPGTVATNRVKLNEREAARARGVELHEYRRDWLTSRAKESPLGRVAQPEDIASVVTFLLTGASGYITGECVQVSGGRSAM